METLAIIFGIGVLSSFVGSFVSGSLSLLSVPLMLFAGIPPVTALATLKVGALGFDAGGLIRYIQEKKVHWDLFVPLLIASVLGYSLGSYLLVLMNPDFVIRIVGVIMILCTPLVLWKKDLGTVTTAVTRNRRWMGHFTSFLVWLYAGSFALGVGVFMSLQRMYFYGLTVIDAKATGKLPTIIGGISSVFVFWWFGSIEWSYAIALITGMFVGGYFGVKYSIKFGNQNLKYLLILSMLFFGIKFAFGL